MLTIAASSLTPSQEDHCRVRIVCSSVRCGTASEPLVQLGLEVLNNLLMVLRLSIYYSVVSVTDYFQVKVAKYYVEKLLAAYPMLYKLTVTYETAKIKRFKL